MCVVFLFLSTKLSDSPRSLRLAPDLEPAHDELEEIRQQLRYRSRYEAETHLSQSVLPHSAADRSLLAVPPPLDVPVCILYYKIISY